MLPQQPVESVQATFPMHVKQSSAVEHHRSHHVVFVAPPTCNVNVNGNATSGNNKDKENKDNTPCSCVVHMHMHDLHAELKRVLLSSGNGSTPSPPVPVMFKVQIGKWGAWVPNTYDCHPVHNAMVDTAPAAINNTSSVLASNVLSTSSQTKPAKKPRESKAKKLKASEQQHKDQENLVSSSTPPAKIVLYGHVLSIDTMYCEDTQQTFRVIKVSCHGLRVLIRVQHTCANGCGRLATWMENDVHMDNLLWYYQRQVALELSW